jgi:dTDP-4-dehydrorhamnose reductase
MKILVLGGAGMLGHQLFEDLRRDHDVRVTLRGDVAAYRRHGVFDENNAYSNVDALSLDRVLSVVGDFGPDVIVNAVGLIKQLSAARESIPSIQMNALLPHRLSQVAKAAGARFIHFSTDCVFSGRRGMYSETDTPDAEDLYGLTKLLGEVSEPHCFTLRTSLIGHELERSASLLEWFLSQKGAAKGFRKAIFSGFTTLEMSRIVKMIVERGPWVHGVRHVSSEPIDKYTLLTLVKKYYGLDTAIVPDDDFTIDRSLDSTRFRNEFGYRPPSWEAMVEELARRSRERRSR